MLNILKPYSQLLSDTLTKVSKDSPEKYIVHELNCSFLSSYTIENIEKSPEYFKIKEKFDSLKNLCVYWFEIILDNHIDNIWNTLRTYKDDKLRTVPATKKNMPKGTNILYLGKVKEGFLGRLKQHLGYCNASTTQSLQLCHWAKELGLILKIHVMEFEEENV